MEASEAANRDNKGRFSTPDKNRKDKTAGRKRGRHGKWSTKKNTTNRENNTKTGRSNTIDLTDTKEETHRTGRSESYDTETDDEPSDLADTKEETHRTERSERYDAETDDEPSDFADTKEETHRTKRSESYDAETDDEPSPTIRTDNSTIEKSVALLRELVEKQGARITALENALEKSTSCDDTDMENQKARASNSDNDELTRTRRHRLPKMIHSQKPAKGERKRRDVRSYTDKKIESLEKWEASFRMNETEKEDRKQATSTNAIHHDNSSDDEYDENHAFFSHKKWESFEKWESDYDSNKEMHTTRNKE